MILDINLKIKNRSKRVDLSFIRMNLKENSKFTSQEYWESRFESEEEFEWLGKLQVAFLDI